MRWLYNNRTGTIRWKCGNASVYVYIGRHGSEARYIPRGSFPICVFSSRGATAESPVERRLSVSWRVINQSRPRTCETRSRRVSAREREPVHTRLYIYSGCGRNKWERETVDAILPSRIIKRRHGDCYCPSAAKFDELRRVRHVYAPIISSYS